MPVVQDSDLLGYLLLPVDRVRSICDRATTSLLHPAPGRPAPVIGAKVAPS